MRFIRQLALVVGVIFFIVSCTGDDNSNSQEPFVDPLHIGSALAQVPLQDRRMAIVHSQSSKAAFYDPIAYNQLYASMQQQAMMAGIPFDLLDESALASTAELLNYDVILIPSFTHVGASDRAAIRTRLLQAQENGVSIITSGNFLAYRPDGNAYPWTDSVLTDVFGVTQKTFLSGVSAAVKIADNTHPISQTYTANEVLTDYDQIWFGSFIPAAGERSTTLTTIESEGVTYKGSQIIDRAGDVVHYANDQVLADNNQLWRVIQWLIYADTAPVTLQLSRSDYVFLGRNDMDQAMIAADLGRTEIPLLDIIKEWKNDYNFVSSYYIDIGNDPAAGEYTDWGVSAPLYQQYIALGNEIGTHSWTHPHRTSRLTAAELEFEFKDSAAEIGNQLGVPVVGAAVPGMGESLFVQETLNPWLEYLSGRTGVVGTGYPGAFGFLEPQHTMMYFSLNMVPDYEAIDVLRYTPAETAAIWKQEIDTVLKHAQQPIVHWLWHDYGPTTQTAAGMYSKEMFTDTVAYAASLGAEFTTVKNMHDRIRTFADTTLSTGSDGDITATVAANDVGQFALKVAEGKKIKSVAGWYAYDDDQVFLPQDGGQFTISLGPVADAVTRITQLPMRAKLLNLSGDGKLLSFSMHGEGEVTIALHPELSQSVAVSGASAFRENNGELTLSFDSLATHDVEITLANRAPVANNGLASVVSGRTVQLQLMGEDVDGDTLSYWVQSQPANGTLSGTAPELRYVSNAGFTGTDSFSFSVNDGALNSTVAQFDITVASATPLPSKPNALAPKNQAEVTATLPIEVSFSHQSDEIKNYQIQRFDRLKLRWDHVKIHTADSICSGSTCRATIPSMAVQDYAVWRVRAQNEQGWGPWSVDSVFNVLAPVLPAQVVTQAPNNVASVTASYPITLSFSHLGDEITNYQVQRFDRLKLRWDYAEIHAANSLCVEQTCSVQIPAMQAQSYAVWRVRAQSLVGWGPWSTDAVFNVVPPVAPDQVLVQVPKNIANVDANAPIAVSFVRQNEEISNYQVQRFDRLKLRWDYVKIHSADSICTSTLCSVDMPAMLAQDYAVWRVRAQNRAGWGPWSDDAVFNVVAPVVPAQVFIQAPKNFQQVAANQAVPVSFTPLPNATQYQLQRYDRIANRWSYVSNHQAAEICSEILCSTTVGALAPQLYAVWRVRAFNVAGWGPWSSAAVFNAQ